MKCTTRKNPFDVVGELAWDCDSRFESSHEAMETLTSYYPLSSETPQKMIDEWRKVRGHKVYHSRNFIWLGQEGRMLRLTQGELDFIHPIERNIFNLDKLCAIAESVKYVDEKIPLECGYASVYFRDCCDILEMKEYEEDYEYYEWSADDANEVYFQLRDGNHRTIGALAAGDDAYVYLMLSEYDEYMEWVKDGKPKDHYRYNTFLYLDKNLV